MDEQTAWASVDRRRFIGVTSAALVAGTSRLAGAASPSPASVPFDRRKWWQQEYRVLQTNLREIDALEDPRDIAKATREFGANVLISNIGGIVAFYPTELALHYRNPYLKGDFASAMVEAAHAEGLAYIGRFDLSKSLQPAFEAHPEWFMRNRDGTAREYAGTYQACPNGGWAQDYALQILHEGVTRYEVDGLFFNMTGFPRTDYADVDHGICVCDNCRRNFRQLYQLDLPEKDDGSDPNWPSYLQFQRRVMAELTAKTTKVAQDARSNVPLLDFYTGPVARGEVQRRVSRAAPEWPHQMGEQVRWFLASNPQKIVSVASAAHMDYPWRQVTESSAAHELRFAQALGSGAKLDLYLMGTLADQDDPRYLERVSRLFRWHARHESDYAGLVPAARVALYNGPSFPDDGKAGLARYGVNAARGAYQALVDARIPFWMTNHRQLVDGGGTRRFDVVILPHVMALTDADAAALDAFVERGGLLIATGYSGALDADHKPRAHQAMRSSPVERFGAPRDAHGWSLDMSKASLPLGPGRMPIDGDFFPVQPRTGSKTLVPFAPDQRFGPPEFSYAQPEKPARSDPGVLAMAHGDGHSIHIPWLPDWLYYRDGLDAHRHLFAALIEHYAPPQPLVLEGPGAVEMMAMAQPSMHRLLVHVINYGGQRNTRYTDPAPVHGLRLGVSGTVARNARLLVAGTTLSGRRSGDRIWFDLPPVGAFEAVQLTTA